MLFNSFIFLGLLLITFILYYTPALSRFQILILILSSLVFYAYNQPALVLLLLSSALINVLTSYYVANLVGNRRKYIATVGVVLNLSILAFFKYGALLESTLIDTNFLVNIPLPIGISFFTFEGISLLVDTYKGNNKSHVQLVDKSLYGHAKKTLFFISFFPHLVAGPILKANDFFPQIQRKHLKDINYDFCFKNLVIGYFLKMVVADNLNDLTYKIAYPYFEALSSVNLIVMLFGYSCQIFADFAGYSLIAIGLACLFGYRFNENFNFPYISTSFKEFWKRWHISLSSFLMEYLYFPLGGNRKGRARTYVNLMITMFLGGLWHGAAWSYAVWGIFHGLALVVERFLTKRVKVGNNSLLKIGKGIIVFSFVSLAWLLFKLPDFAQAVYYFASIAGNTYIKNSYFEIFYILLYCLPVVLYHAHYLMKSYRIPILFKQQEYVYYALMLFFILTNSGNSGSFIYFQF
ncbi:MBOAT family protein [Spirosoma sp. KNUC1025]|uniref:MBOAT family O-acyltransferase n=1 Tax=Spirosoma sp. KNUC1025 TaxID=2894082 RepID=UPI0038703A56|nr:MBOAT family protein [Spirosoma sp. KNUC1025]